MTTTATGLIYDADCGFCTKSANWLANGRPWTPISWQSIPDLGELDLTVEMVQTAAYWLEDGRAVAGGADAIAAALQTHRGYRKALGWIIASKPIRPVARAVYGKVAVNRHKMPGGTAACELPR